MLHSICYNLTFSDWVETIFTFLHKLGLVSVGCLKILGVQYFIDWGKVSKIIYCFCEISIYNWFENSFQMKPPFWVWSVSSLIVGLQSNLVFKFALTDFSEKIFLWLIGFFLKWIYQGNLIFAKRDIWYPIYLLLDIENVMEFIFSSIFFYPSKANPHQSRLLSTIILSYGVNFSCIYLH